MVGWILYYHDKKLGLVLNIVTLDFNETLVRFLHPAGFDDWSFVIDGIVTIREF
jgi:hypothetical protein